MLVRRLLAVAAEKTGQRLQSESARGRKRWLALGDAAAALCFGARGAERGAAEGMGMELSVAPPWELGTAARPAAGFTAFRTLLRGLPWLFELGGAVRSSAMPYLGELELFQKLLFAEAPPAGPNSCFPEKLVVLFGVACRGQFLLREGANAEGRRRRWAAQRRGAARRRRGGEGRRHRRAARRGGAARRWRGGGSCGGRRGGEGRRAAGVEGSPRGDVGRGWVASVRAKAREASPQQLLRL